MQTTALRPDGTSRNSILFVRRQYSPFGGGEIMLDTIAKEFHARDMAVAIMSGDWPTSEGIKFIRCTARHFPRAWRARSFATAACRMISQLDPAPVLVQSNDRLPCCDIFRAGEGVHAAYLAERRRLSKLDGAGLHLSLFHKEMLRLERRTFQSARLRAVIAISKMVADDIRRHYDFPGDRIHHIPNGISLAAYNASLREEHRARVRAQLNVAPDKPVILFVGSGFTRKGLAPLIEATAHLESRPELWVVGHDTRMETFRRIAQKRGLGDRVRFVGPQKDVRPWYGAADIAALPSVYEPFGTVVLEAMACGLPTVVSTMCGGRELVERFDAELVCNIADREGLARSLRRALQHSCSPGAAALARRAASKYNLDTMIDRTLSLYESVLAEKRQEELAWSRRI
ncbi:glycosyltransferase family 4 protein [Mesorhizobium sp. WSM4976]|uniref:glycosyltransferase family 4 protein n=1 Tax=Mesorhizobium sp. WSM4976 TaxID=3038549 RepID=UPI0024169D81|nr:glycosyltransferase family 4 protein [Mesorhizobium sp. WSM4976]MDG4897528.1 glycosyltransferase family 4 protein [Mesorhizobium sp. WSM4976]